LPDSPRSLHSLSLHDALPILFSRSGWPRGSILADLLSLAGLVLILACIAGRCWASLYVGGRKNQELVTAGPYAHMRNPLYFFSIDRKSTRLNSSHVKNSYAVF